MAWGMVAMYTGFLQVKKFHADPTHQNPYSSQGWRKPMTKSMGSSGFQVWLEGDCLYTNSLRSHCTQTCLNPTWLTHLNLSHCLHTLHQLADGWAAAVGELMRQVGLGVVRIGWCERTGWGVRLLEVHLKDAAGWCGWRGMSGGVCLSLVGRCGKWVDNHRHNVAKVAGSGGYPAHHCDGAKRVRREGEWLHTLSL